MSNSTFWNILVYLTAVLLVIISSPFIVTLFIAKFFDVLCSYILDKFSENPLSAFLISKRDAARKLECGDDKESDEDE